jgi:hypothetical protein
MQLKVGDWVRVRSKAEILATLDTNGRLENLPFMPQMFRYCGQEFQVHKRAHKTCDTVSGRYDSRRLAGGIHLNLRCDGQAYDGCQAACLIYWKDAWLEPISAPTAAKSSASGSPAQASVSTTAGCTEANVLRATCSLTKEGKQRYSCQATQLLDFTQPVPWWDMRQYYEDYSSGNTSLSRILSGLAYVVYYYGTLANRYNLGRPARWLYTQFQKLRGGVPFPREKGYLRTPAREPTCDLDLQPGEVVRVKPYEEILATINHDSNANRGLYFDAEMVPFCGKEFVVRASIDKFIDERTGFVRRLKTPAVILEGGYCKACFSDKRMFCPREIFSWWREIWLERVSEEPRAVRERENELERGAA